MTRNEPTCPMTRGEVVQRYFMEHRAKLIDIAAFLDRLDRARGDSGVGARVGGEEDFRIASLRAAIKLLDDGKPERARRILELFSDHSTEPIDSAAGLKGAFGADPAGVGAAAGSVRGEGGPR